MVKEQIDDNTLWYIREEDNKGLFDTNNTIYYTNVKDTFSNTTIRTRNLSANYTARYKDLRVMVQPITILFEDKINKHLIVKGNIVNY